MQQCNKATIDNSQNTRRVEKYKESFDSAQDEGGKTKVFKTVAFYLAEYVSGSPEDHGWEMSEAGWFDYENALDLMAFKGEKAALIKAYNILYIRSEKTPIRQLADGDESAKMERRRRDCPPIRRNWNNR